MYKALLLAALVALIFPVASCDENSVSTSNTRCLSTESPVASNGFMVIGTDGTATVYDFDSVLAESPVSTAIHVGFGTVDVTTFCSNVRLGGAGGDTSSVRLTLQFGGTRTGVYQWEEGQASRSGVKVIITGGPHSGSYSPLSGSTEISEITLGASSIVKARFCGTIADVGGRKLTIRGGRISAR